MKTPLALSLLLGIALAPPAAPLAGETTPLPTWHAQTLWEALGQMLLFAAIGIAAAIVGYKVFDKCTPGNLHKEIIENKNVAAALVAGAVILGVCVIIAAAMIG
ncbi:MAG: DUF350 domain-containing protein [Verrucomicrobiae bacterium]|nr:DUF350 domain-containing protein [Verrucomicrobiae bacterium]